MGAETFIVRAKGETAEVAFSNAVEKAQWEYGHRGYTGTIAEKREFTIIEKPEWWSEAPISMLASAIMDASTLRLAPGKELDWFLKQQKLVDDKWGPAGCIEEEPGVWVFFGWAST